MKRMFTIILLGQMFMPFIYTNGSNLTDSLERVLTTTTDTAEVNLMLKLSRLYFKERFDHSRGLVIEAIVKSRALSYDKGLGNGLNALGIFLMHRASYDSALSIFREAGVIKQRTNDQVGLSNVLNNIGLAYKAKGSYTKALEYFYRSLHIRKLKQQKKAIAQSYNNIGLIYEAKGDFESAMDLYQKSLAVKKELNDRYGISVTLGNIGLINSKKGDYTAAVDNYVEAIRIKEELNDKRGLAKMFGHVGTIYLLQKNYDPAIRYLEKALTISTDLKDKKNIAAMLNNIGNLYYDKNDYEAALAEYWKALEIRREIKDQHGIAFTLNNIGNVYEAQGRYIPALEYHKQSLQMKKEMGDNRGIASTLSNMGNIYQKTADYTRALDLYLESLAISRKLNLKDYIASNYLSLAETYERAGNYPKAIRYYKRHKQIRDSLLSDQQGKLIAEMQAKFELKEKDREIQLLEQQNEITSLQLTEEQSKLKRQKTFRNILLVSILLTLIIFYLLYSQYVQKKKNNESLKQAVEQLKRSNKELSAARARAEKSEHFMEQFLANVSHEIRTPLNAVIGMTHLLMNTKPDKEQLKYLETVKFAADNLLVIINDILDLSKIQADQFTFESLPFRLVDVVDGVRATVTLRAEEKNIRLVSDFDPELPPYLIGDPTRLNQILLNLLNNAVKFTEEGTVRLSVKQQLRTLKSVNILFIVEDSGIGIPEDQLSNIFDHFRQADPSTSREYGGTGLGLTIARHLVKLLGGNITVKSTVGKGSEFSFELAYPIAGSSQRNGKPLPTVEAVDISGARVLLVEDNSFNQEVVMETLRGKVDQVDIAENGEQAIELVREKDYDIILMDIKMPKMDGFETTQYIRMKLSLPKEKLPIIAITANASRAERERCFAVGMNAYLSKPFVPEVLLQKLMQSLGADHLPGEHSPGLLKSNEIIDLTILKEVVGSDPAKLEHFITLFRKESQREIRQMKEDFARKNWEDLKRTAHSLKSKAGYLGITGMQQLLQEIEQNNDCENHIKQINRKLEKISRLQQQAYAALDQINVESLGI